MIFHVFAFFFVIIAVNGSSCNGMSKWQKDDMLVLDTDASLSDGFGMTIAITAARKGLAPPVVGITCVRGPFTTVSDACRNVGKLLIHLNATNIPIYEGTNRSLVITPAIRTSLFGDDAFGDVPYDETLLPPIQEENAVAFMTRIARQHKGKVIFVGMAPVAHYALAQLLDEDFIHNAKVILTSTGNVQGLGDFLPGVESKAAHDPEAAKVVLEEGTYEKVYQLPYEAIYETNHAIPVEFWNKFYALPGAKVIQEISQIYLDNGAPSGYVFGDPLVTSAYLDTKIIDSTIPLRENINLSGDGRGSFLVDWFNKDVDVETSNWLCLRNVNAVAYENFLLRLFDE